MEQLPASPAFDVAIVPAAAFDTNCYLLAPQGASQCLVVDPGIGIAQSLPGALEQLGWSVGAILLTHGHIDHVESVSAVQEAAGAAGHIPEVWIHAADEYRLANPWGDIGPALSALVSGQLGELPPWRAPGQVRTFIDGEQITLAGLTLSVHHAPGHTEGSCLLRMAGTPAGWTGEETGTVLSGDVLFAGSVGRTDLPGGDPAAMQCSLREVVLAQPDELLVLPGHGPATTIGRERNTNPFLQVS